MERLVVKERRKKREGDERRGGRRIEKNGWQTYNKELVIVIYLGG